MVMDKMPELAANMAAPLANTKEMVLPHRESAFFIDNLLVLLHRQPAGEASLLTTYWFFIVMIRWTGLAPLANTKEMV